MPASFVETGDRDYTIMIFDDFALRDRIIGPVDAAIRSKDQPVSQGRPTQLPKWRQGDPRLEKGSTSTITASAIYKFATATAFVGFSCLCGVASARVMSLTVMA